MLNKMYFRILILLFFWKCSIFNSRLFEASWNCVLWAIKRWKIFLWFNVCSFLCFYQTVISVFVSCCVLCSLPVLISSQFYTQVCENNFSFIFFPHKKLNFAIQQTFTQDIQRVEINFLHNVPGFCLKVLKLFYVDNLLNFFLSHSCHTRSTLMTSIFVLRYFAKIGSAQKKGRTRDSIVNFSQVFNSMDRKKMQIIKMWTSSHVINLSWHT